MNERDLSVVLGALRYYQRVRGVESDAQEEDIITDGGRFDLPSDERIDDLITRLNIGDAALVDKVCPIRMLVQEMSWETLNNQGGVECHGGANCLGNRCVAWPFCSGWLGASL